MDRDPQFPPTARRPVRRLPAGRARRDPAAVAVPPSRWRPLWITTAIVVALSSCATQDTGDGEWSIRDEAATDETGDRVLGRALLRQARDELAVLSQPALILPLDGLATSRPPRSIAQSPATMPAPAGRAGDRAVPSPAADIALATAADPGPAARGIAASTVAASPAAAPSTGLATGAVGAVGAVGAAGAAALPIVVPGDPAASVAASAAPAAPPAAARSTPAAVAPAPSAAPVGSPTAPLAQSAPGADAGPVALPVAPRPTVAATEIRAAPPPDDPRRRGSEPSAGQAAAPSGGNGPGASTLTAALRTDVTPLSADTEPLDVQRIERGTFATMMGAMYGMVERCDGQTMMRDQTLKSFRSTYALVDLDRKELNDPTLRRRVDSDFERTVAAARAGAQIDCDYVRAQSYRWRELATDLRRMDRQSALQYRQGLITEIRRGAGLGFN